MHEEKISGIMQKVADGKISVEAAIKKLKFLPFEDLGFAKIDHHRTLRKGFPEVAFCQNKTVEQAVKIVTKLASSNDVVIATRATEEMFKEIKKNAIHMNINEQLGKLKTFALECKRVFIVTKKPTKEEFKTIVKVSGLGMILIGLVGFLLILIKQLVF